MPLKDWLPASAAGGALAAVCIVAAAAPYPSWAGRIDADDCAKALTLQRPVKGCWITRSW